MIRAAAVLVIAALVVYLYAVGLETADKLASALGLIVALTALLISLLFRRPGTSTTDESDRVARPDFSYLEYVRQIAPLELHGREAELDQLKSFCGSGDGFYWRWIAGPWAGKSALLSWFVLHPPPEVEVVSFFVNGRFNPHHNRDAFIDALTEQLAELLDRPVQSEVPDLARVARLRSLVGEAASACQFRGRRLVLVVDGLDEDRLFSSEQEIFSIAALLPDKPVHGLKVVVAGRPDPPLPVDVPADHPLRDPSAVHELSASASAKASEQAATHELNALLRDPNGQDVLGLITAAGGGLSAFDLAELTGQSLHDVRSLLTSSSGRTFSTRRAEWRRDSTPHGYGFAHEELRVATARSLGPAVLRSCSDRLDQWASRYRAEGWPEDTPEYLLRGYVGKLLDAGAYPEAVSLAVDNGRHDLMLARTETHRASLLEINSVAAALLAQPVIDLAAVALLAYHRNEVERHTSNLPTELPAVWARLGEFDKAHSLAESIVEGWGRKRARELILDVAAEQGNIARLEAATRPTEPLALRIYALDALFALAAGQERRAELVGVAQELIAAGASPFDRFLLVRAIGGAGHPEAALAAAEGLPDKSPAKVESLVELSDQALARGATAEARELARRAVLSVEGMETADRSRAFVAVLRSEAVGADRTWGDELFDWAAESAGQISAVRDRLWQLARVAMAAHRTGRGDRAEQLAGQIDAEILPMRGKRSRRTAVEDLAGLLSSMDDLDGALELLAREREVYDSDEGGDVLRPMVRACLAAGDVQQAATLAARIADSRQRSSTLVTVVSAHCEAGRLQDAVAVKRAIADPDDALAASGQIAKAAIAAGDRELGVAVLGEAERTIDEVRPRPGSNYSARSICELAAVAAALEDRPRAIRLAGLAVAPGNEMEFWDPTSTALSKLARRLLELGELDRAEEVNQRITRSFDRVRMTFWPAGTPRDDARGEEGQVEFAALGRTLAPLVAQAQAGQPQEAAAAAWKVCEGFLSLFGTASDRDMTAALAAIGAAGGWPDIVRSADGPTGRSGREMALARLAEAAMRAGDEAGTAIVSAWLEEAAPELLRAATAVILTETDPAAGAVLLQDLVRDLGDRPSGYRRERSLLQVQRFLTSAQAYDAAEDLVNEFDVGLPRADSVSEVAAAEAVAGLDDRWESLVARDDPDHRDQHLREVAKAVAEAGDYRRAAAILRRSDMPVHGHGQAFLAVIGTAAENGDLDFAVQVLTKPGCVGADSYDLRSLAAVRGWCLLVSAAQAVGDQRAGTWSRRAEELVEATDEGDRRLSGLIALAEIAPPPKARLLVARAFGVGEWGEPLELMSSLDPAALIRLADSLIERLAVVEPR